MERLPVISEYRIGEDKIAEFEIAPISFNQFLELVSKCLPNVSASDTFSVLIQRERLISQVTALTESGSKVKLTPVTLISLPVVLARKLIKLLDVGEGVAGKVISQGADGVTSPILYKLGTPLGSGENKIEEIEFFASTFGDIEHVLVEDNQMFQTRALMQRAAKPVGMVSMPSWAASSLTLADGFFIMNEVLPSFLE